jgi:hypothetical protein
VTLLHVRKWVQVLQGRSLVLGHVDKPMVHDLVRDFCMAQFSPETQARVHLALVKTFVRHRTVNAHGQRR